MASESDPGRGRVGRPRLAAIIPALNEEESVGIVLSAMPRHWFRQIIVVDNGSTDRTAEVAASFGNPVQVIREDRRGYGQACLAGIGALHDCDVVVFLDADASDDVSDLPRLLRRILSGEADMVIGSRMRRADASAALPASSRFGNWLAATVLRIVWGTHWTDLGPFRAINREALERIGMRDTNYGWTIEMQIKAARHRLRCREVAVGYRPRPFGESKITGNFLGSIRACSKIILTIARYTLFR